MTGKEYGGQKHEQSIGGVFFRKRCDREPSIIDTFMESYDFSGKTVVPFATSGMSPVGDSGKNMQELARGAKVVSGKRFKNSATAEELKVWADEWL